MQRLAVLGATGSIGTNTLDVLSRHQHHYQVTILAAYSNVAKMLELCLVHKPKYAVLLAAGAAKQLSEQLPSALNCEIIDSLDGLCQLMASDSYDTVMSAIVGAAGLLPTMAAVKQGKKVLLANKESLVMSGELFMQQAQQSGSIILPVDSEHNAIFQCLPDQIKDNLGHCDLSSAGVERILLTGSGGPFLNHDISALSQVTPEQACKHPNWSMGRKISVDSATMMNKGLEYIEAKWLFNASAEQIQVVIHPQSVIHSMVQYKDGSTVAQLGQPDMRTPIAHCLAHPQRIEAGVEPLDFFRVGQLSFVEPNYQRYPGLKMAIDACHQGQSYTTALNAANEEAVAAFLDKKIGFTDIYKANAEVLNFMQHQPLDCLDAILEWDKQARRIAQGIIKRMH
ncbi:1-deoxy-D-xylulose-5-phosphate reductoisomerase [Paraferrimonas sp. SM1919]|uniref:1-deoxy-D-xylulose-5-phosphate reductoisomerase n=1 Tax=Paraferrimonas sp. SM1919 TaxID=2662263 RepID=UPI0013D376AD|nr:1-deoxy-D-xylulose-5-phosphate reductoisomerase [Paraferrimonas sp. SM1919]